MSGIESYLFSLSTEVDNLNEQKSLLEKQIITSTQTKENEKEEKINIIEERKSKIQLLQKKMMNWWKILIEKNKFLKN